ncbi:MAG: AAA family ATPase [Phycisphaerales bacterium]|nr:AAA family ATPase [Phycisphaerales bacterium]
MLSRIEFKNFRILRDAAIDLERFTLMIGPNASGKSTVFRAIEAAQGHVNQKRDGSGVFAPFKPAHECFDRLLSRHVKLSEDSIVQVKFIGNMGSGELFNLFGWSRSRVTENSTYLQAEVDRLNRMIGAARFYSLEPSLIERPSAWTTDAVLGPAGERLSLVLTKMQDTEPERFEALNREFSNWLPEFDRIILDSAKLVGVGDVVQSVGTVAREFLLRFRQTKATIRASDVSGGTLVALALLTLAHLPEPPGIICLEEPDRGLHPRALTLVRDAIFRLAYPERSGESRKPVQVLATTHSPYFLDLFRDYTDHIVVAEKTPDGATFSSLSKRADIDEILAHGPLGEVWYSGVLGGVPVDT